MKFDFCKWRGWDVVKCLTAKYELIVLVSAGPRIISLRFLGHENLLYEDALDFRVKDWRIYGGHRFTVGPETDASYEPDNLSCALKIVEGKLFVTATKKASDVVLTMIICENEEGFSIDHVLENKGDQVWSGVLWAITCIPRFTQVTAACNTSKINFWQGTDPSNWLQNDGQISFKAGDYTGKAGWYASRPTIIALQDQGTLIVSSDDNALPEECVDHGSNLELYVNRDFIEMETLSRSLFVLPGESECHQQKWALYPPLN